MVDYIAREAVRQALRDPVNRGFHFTEYDLDRIPCADAEPVRHARWEKRYTFFFGVNFGEKTVCSACGEEAPEITAGGGAYLTSDYCPNCGAKMDGDSNG